jgi:hypothetical protein
MENNFLQKPSVHFQIVSSNSHQKLSGPWDEKQTACGMVRLTLQSLPTMLGKPLQRMRRVAYSVLGWSFRQAQSK